MPQLIFAQSIFMRHRKDPRDPDVRDPYARESVKQAYLDNCRDRDEAGVRPLPLPSGMVPSDIYKPADLTLEQLGVLEATDAIYRQIEAHGVRTVRAWVTADDAPWGFRHLVQQYGSDRVLRWIKTLAVIANQDFDARPIDEDRPLDRCLADGALLPSDRICPRCGRDNN